MKRIAFYLLKALAFISRAINKSLYMRFVIYAHKSQGVIFNGKPDYIQQDAYLDPSGGLIIEKDVVISTKVIILTHDWSFLKRANSLGGVKFNPAFKKVTIGENSFIGAGAIVLPGTTIGKNCIIGAGSVVKGIVEDYSIVAGNPCRVIGDTRK
ncbi:acyltransferase [Muribaculaceae bacterium Isolate-110 (HZI)]|nr:acyltransferase [Muribaculaceae bacterium Isolate-110 (HZI)]